MKQIVFALLFITVPVISRAGEITTRVYKMPIKNELGTQLATVGVFLQSEGTGAHACKFKIDVKQLEGRETPMSYVVTEALVSDIRADKSGAHFGLSIDLAWKYKTTPGGQRIGRLTSQCHITCGGEVSCK
jgi:hypothetical protein